ncbi:MAG TPA: lipoyl(octanoyl) transferase LipB [Terracidiphilus sp.]|nr:lipoyl(octanoyl) transferase LipB [Terracidiphilus sp.]
MIQYLYLGRVAYGEALRIQAELVALRQQNRIGNALLLLEHPPVLTLGRNASRANVLASEEQLARRGVTIHEINRGGDVTYHGPGQLIGYPIFDLRSLHNTQSARLGPVDFVRMMEEALIGLCSNYGVSAGRICGLTGVWCPTTACTSTPNSSKRLPSAGPPGARKIASIGIHVARGVTSHGFAFNVTTDLRDFELINPCGITGCQMTTLKLEADREAGPRAQPLPSLDVLAGEAAQQFSEIFRVPIEKVQSLDALRAPAEEDLAQPHFPAQDTPLEIPREVERLRYGRIKDRPVRA